MLNDLLMAGFKNGLIVAISFGFLGLSIGYAINILNESTKG
ncbi:hypothetical protein [Schinkia azotoformans]